MESVKYWCFICKKECTPVDNEEEKVCNLCGSSFIEELDTSSGGSDDPKTFVPDLHPGSLSTTTAPNTMQVNQPLSFSSFPVVSFQFNISPNGQVNFSSNQGLQNANIFQQVNNIFSFNNMFTINQNNFGNNPLLSFLNVHNNDPQFENLLNFIMIHDPNRYGTPPASKKAIDELERLIVNEENENEYKDLQCYICLYNFEKGETVIKLKCKHDYHENCILDWLKLHNSCPVCRHEMESNDPDYENRKNSNRDVLRNYNNMNNRNNRGNNGGSSTGL